MDRIPQQKEDRLKHAARCLASIGEPNHSVARRFLDWKVHRDRQTVRTAVFYAQIARDLNTVLDGRPYHTMTHDDGDRYMTFRSQSLATDTLAGEASQARHFLKWVLRDAGQVDLTELPYRLRQSLTIRTGGRRMKREVPISRAEFDALLAVRKDDPCTQALYWLCYDAGVRIGEALVLNIGEIDKQDDGGAIINIPDVEGFTKTHDRAPYILESMPALKTWMDLNPFDAQPDAPLFTTLTKPYRRATYRAVWGRLQHDLKRAGVRANVHFHLFRKTSATRRVRTMDPDQFHAFHGWSPGSKVASQYILDSVASSRGAIRREAGITDEGQPVPKLDVGMKTCPYCAESIKAAAVKCRHCGEMLTTRPRPASG